MTSVAAFAAALCCASLLALAEAFLPAGPGRYNVNARDLCYILVLPHDLSHIRSRLPVARTSEQPAYRLLPTRCVLQTGAEAQLQSACGALPETRQQQLNRSLHEESRTFVTAARAIWQIACIATAALASLLAEQIRVDALRKVWYRILSMMVALFIGAASPSICFATTDGSTLAGCCIPILAQAVAYPCLGGNPAIEVTSPGKSSNVDFLLHPTVRHLLSACVLMSTVSSTAN